MNRWKGLFFVYVVLVTLPTVLFYVVFDHKARQAEYLIVAAVREFLLANDNLEIAIQENLIMFDRAFHADTPKLCLPDPYPVLHAAEEAEKHLLNVRNIALDGYWYQGALPLSDMKKIQQYAGIMEATEILLERIRSTKVEYQKDSTICFLRTIPGIPV